MNGVSILTRQKTEDFSTSRNWPTRELDQVSISHGCFMIGVLETTLYFSIQDYVPATKSGHSVHA
jgi:hypothetical protein